MKSQTTIRNAQITGEIDYLEIAIHGFLADRKAQNLTKGTIYFYKYNLKIFTAYCEAQAVKNVSHEDT